jgi:N-acetyl-D-muramate 6-phosphate phosphatase
MHLRLNCAQRGWHCRNMALDLSRIRALCFDVDGTIADTDDHLVASLAQVIDSIPLVSGRRAERLARQVVMGMESPVHGAYALLDQLGLDAPVSRLRARLKAVKKQGIDPEHTPTRCRTRWCPACRRC